MSYSRCGWLTVFTEQACNRCRPEEQEARIVAILESFGLTEQAHTRVGTSMQKGISEGQKRRLGVATQLITGPRILFLDEPTSGLDSVASFQIISHLRALVKRYRLIVICSIHQPSTSTFNLFDKLLLLSAGKTHYFGPTSHLMEHYEAIGVEVAQRANPADVILELVNIDFSHDREGAFQRVSDLQTKWQLSTAFCLVNDAISAAKSSTEGLNIDPTHTKPSVGGQILTLLFRNFLKARLDGIAYTGRIVMYMAFAVLMGTVWLQLDHNQDSIQLRVNSLIVNCGFMSFMAVTYVPAFIEDYRQYIQEHSNGLYGPSRFCIANFLVGLPYIFLFSLASSVIFYWLSNCVSSATAFFTWVMWMFLDLVAAEAVVVFAVTIIPTFVGALILATLMNILFFVTGGALVPPLALNAFYRNAIYYWSYQSYVFQGIMVSQFTDQTYVCADGCHCLYDSKLANQCQIPGQAILDRFGYKASDQGRNISIIIAITVVFRLASWVVIKLKH